VLRRGDAKVALGDADDMGGAFAAAASAARTREQRERREDEGPQSHVICFDRYETCRLTQMGET
jgi:hypothetical protein